MVLEQQLRHDLTSGAMTMRQTESTGNGASLLKPSSPPTSDTPPPKRPHLPILPRHFHQLGSEDSYK